jgi:hypothetical protein
MRNSRHKTSLIAVFVVAATVTFVCLLLYWSWGSLLSTQNSSTSPSPSPANASPAPANQNTAPQSLSSPKPEADRSTTETIVKGTVKKESGDVVNGAVIVLFNGDRRGAEPQKVDDDGRFRFDKIPVKSDASYSVQTKVPGFCGEKSFTSAAIDAQHTIYADIVLKPCQTQSPGPSPTPVKTENPDLQRISEGLTGLVHPLDSMKSWVKSLAITYILTILVLLLATVGLIFLKWRHAGDDRAQIESLVRWRPTVDGELKKLNTQTPTATLVFPSEVSQSLQQVLDALTKLAPAIQPGVKQTGNSYFESAPVGKERPVRASASGYQAPSYNSASDENDWYRKLLQNEITSPTPRYVQINSDLSDTSLLSHNPQICFDEGQNHGPFVIFEDGDGAGWIFPSPGSNFTADHHHVFNELDPKNFDQQRANIIKKRVLVRDGRWRLVL